MNNRSKKLEISNRCSSVQSCSKNYIILFNISQHESFVRKGRKVTPRLMFRVGHKKPGISTNYKETIYFSDILRNLGFKFSLLNIKSCWQIFRNLSLIFWKDGEGDLSWNQAQRNWVFTTNSYFWIPISLQTWDISNYEFC